MRLQNRTFRWDRAGAIVAAASLVVLSAAIATAQQPAAPRQPLRERQPIRENLRERVQQNAPQRVTAFPADQRIELVYRTVLIA